MKRLASVFIWTPILGAAGAGLWAIFYARRHPGQTKEFSFGWYYWQMSTMVFGIYNILAFIALIYGKVLP